MISTMMNNLNHNFDEGADFMDFDNFFEGDDFFSNGNN